MSPPMRRIADREAVSAVLAAAAMSDDDPDFTNADLHNLDLRGLDLECADFTGADLRRADLRGVNLAWANLTEVDLRGARLRGARLHRAYLAETTLDGVDLDGVALGDADFTPNMDAKVFSQSPLLPGVHASPSARVTRTIARLKHWGHGLAHRS